MELSAVAAGALSGALHGIRRQFDLVGIIVIGVATGLGGGILRDVMIAKGPVLALRHPLLLVTTLAASCVGVLLRRHTHQVRPVLWLADALLLGLATVTGIQRAEEVGLTLLPALLLGVLTGTGGGLLRDLLCNETPMLLVPGEPYATAALFGGVIYHALRHGLGWPTVIAEWATIAASFTWRVLGDWRRWASYVPLGLSAFGGRRPRPRAPPPPPPPFSDSWS